MILGQCSFFLKVRASCNAWEQLVLWIATGDSNSNFFLRFDRSTAHTGGVHYNTQGPFYIDSYLRPALQAIHRSAEACHEKSKGSNQLHPARYKLHITVSGMRGRFVFM